MRGRGGEGLALLVEAGDACQHPGLDSLGGGGGAVDDGPAGAKADGNSARLSPRGRPCEGLDRIDHTELPGGIHAVVRGGQGLFLAIEVHVGDSLDGLQRRPGQADRSVALGKRLQEQLELGFDELPSGQVFPVLAGGGDEGGQQGVLDVMVDAGVALGVLQRDRLDGRRGDPSQPSGHALTR